MHFKMSKILLRCNREWERDKLRDKRDINDWFQKFGLIFGVEVSIALGAKCLYKMFLDRNKTAFHKLKKFKTAKSPLR